MTSGRLNRTRVESMSFSSPPGGASDGDIYVVADSATGDWAGQEGNIATLVPGTSGWFFREPIEGEIIVVDDAGDREYVYQNATDWTGDAPGWVVIYPEWSASGVTVAEATPWKYAGLTESARVFRCRVPFSALPDGTVGPPQEVSVAHGQSIGEILSVSCMYTDNAGTQKWYGTSLPLGSGVYIVPYVTETNAVFLADGLDFSSYTGFIEFYFTQAP